ncbi:cytochrome c oxidase assembly factor CtaG [Brevibacillus massiliensis]|uniref:cytochrome c oxidase assembly factor CtaG n=1 Tax=Brevibacillus massiliensis TaxID=1118054 RepID=UPI000307C8D2|nr:cytochrome c oxidase assembly factor CtaG [Brevibacillus massiliensis]
MALQDFLAYYGFQIVWSPDVILITLFIATAYLLVVTRFRDYFPDSSPVKFYQKALFLLGLLLFYAGMGSPLNLIGHFMFSIHMLQQSFLYFIMPPLIYLGTPVWLFRALFRTRLFKKAAVVLTNPIFTVLFFNMMFSFYHYPGIFDAVMENYLLDNLFHFTLIVAAFLMWFPVLCPVPEMNRLSELRKMGYIFVNGALLLPACGLIIFAGSPVYSTYINGPSMLCTPFSSASLDGGPTLLTTLSTINDQQLGGIVMKFFQEIAYSSALAYNFFKWFNKEKKTNVIDSPDPQRT